MEQVIVMSGVCPAPSKENAPTEVTLTMSDIGITGGASNSRAVQVRVETLSVSRANGQRRHDLRLGALPDYINKPRSHLNRVLITPLSGAELREACTRRRNKRVTQRAMKSTAAVGIAGIITFGHEAQPIFEHLALGAQDIAYREVAEAVAKHLATTLTGLVVHCDESAPHAHFQLVGYCLDGIPVSTATKRTTLRELQTLTAEVMGRHAPGIERGRSKIDRLKGGATPAEVVHRSVAELHDDLPHEIAALKAQVQALQARIAEAEERTAVSEERARKALERAEAAEGKAAGTF